MSIITEYPIWFSLFCLLLGAGYTALLYYRNQRHKELSNRLLVTLGILRFLLVSVLSFLLLGPMFKALLTELEIPIVVIAQDNSESISSGKDTAFYNSDYGRNMDELVGKLSEDHEVRTYSFGEQVREGLPLDFTDKQTDIAGLINELEILYSNRNVGAIIIASDGMYNKGMNPLYAAGLDQLDAPLYTLALGDTSLRKDLVVQKVAHNQLAYLGNDFPIEVMIHAGQCKGEQTELRVMKDGKVIRSVTVEVKTQSFLVTVPFVLNAEEKGIQHYQIELAPVSNEISTVNNYMDIYIDVLDNRQQVLLLADGPHPDVSAVRSAIEANKNYELDMVLAADKRHPVFKAQEAILKYNLVILHQLPAKSRQASNLIKRIMESEIPVLCILGRKSDVNTINAMPFGFSIKKSGGRYNEVHAVINDESKLFSIGPEMASNMSGYPPLQVPFGEYVLDPGVNVFLHQKIGQVITAQPLLLFNNREKVKRGTIMGEGIWRWRLREYQLSGSHEAFDQLVSKVVQYLSLQEDKSPFRVLSKNQFLENEKVIFDAEVYNETYELINEPEVSMSIVNEEGKQFPFVFRQAGSAYKLDAGQLEVGVYSYQATVGIGDKVHLETGVFSVKPIQVEAVRSVADHHMLNTLALKKGGQMVPVQEMAELAELINNREAIKPIAYTTTLLEELIHLKWIFFLLLGWVSLEWFLRKRNGVY